jgi:hypothetical protein
LFQFGLVISCLAAPALRASVIYDITITPNAGYSFPTYEVSHTFSNYQNGNSYTFTLADLVQDPISSTGESYAISNTLTLNAAGTAANITDFELANTATPSQIFELLTTVNNLAIPYDASTTPNVTYSPVIVEYGAVGSVSAYLGTLTLTITGPSGGGGTTPEPATFALTGLALGCLWAFRRKI